MTKSYLSFLVILSCALVNGGGCNFFTDVSVKNSDDAIIDDINNLVDKRLWYDAAQKLTLISAAGKQRRDVKLLSAGVYAGKGGLDIIALINALNANASSGTKTLFQELMTAFPGATAINYNDELTAQSYIFSISNNATLRTIDENIFMIFLEFAKLGTMISELADTNHDTILDPAFDNCSHAMVPDANASEIIVGVAEIVQSLGAAGSSIAGTSLTAVTSVCNDPNVTALGVCNTVDPSTLPAAAQTQAYAFARTLLGEIPSGIGLKVPANAVYVLQPALNLCP